MVTTTRKLWILGWMLAACAAYVTVSGQSAYLPVYLADGYLALFAFAVALYRSVTISRDEELTFASFAVMYLSALFCALLIGWTAPTIGEPNYCWATLRVARFPPHVFRCTTMPFAFVGFLAGFWVSGWILMRLVHGIQSRAGD